MKRSAKVIAAIAFAAVFCCISIAFATVNDQLNIFGSLSMEVKTTAMLEEGSVVHDAILDVAPGVERVIFDSYSVYSELFSLESGTNIHTVSSPEGSIKLFYLDANKTAYILSNDTAAPVTIYANPLSDGMFKNITTLKEVRFYNLDTSRCTNTSEMFSGCSSLAVIFANEDPDMEGVTRSEDMFLGCTALSGGYGTAVYPGGTASLLDKTYARLDRETVNGYYTYSFSFNIPYFESNILSTDTEAPTYTVKGGESFATVANGVDSSTYSDGDLVYLLSTYIKVEGAWVLHESHTETLAGGAFRKNDHTVTPVTKDGVTYSEVKLVATGMVGGVKGAERQAIFVFDDRRFETAAEYKNGVLYLTVKTNADGGAYAFSWRAGLVADGADPNLIFHTVPTAATTHTATLNAYTVYKFCFFISDSELAAGLDASTLTAAELFTVARS